MKEILYTKQEVRLLQSRPYNTQINVAVAKILEACQKSDFKIFVAFSGGKDSSCLLYLVAKVWESLKENHNNSPLQVVMNDTTIEYQGMIKHAKKFINWIEQECNISIEFHITRPKNGQNFVSVYKNIGLPLISKNVARAVRFLKDNMTKFGISYNDIIQHKDNTIENVQWAWKMFNGNKTITLYLYGYTSSINKFGSSYKLANKWLPLLNAPFDLTEDCCSILKHSNIPDSLVKYSSLTGEMAEESEQRLKAYQKTGCNLFKNGQGKSKPFGPVTLNTLLRYIKENDIPLFSYYGEVDCTSDGVYYTTGMHRTGCALCGFGIEYDKDRFIRLMELEPARVRFAFKSKSEGGLGYKEAFEYCNRYCGTNWGIPEI